MPRYRLFIEYDGSPFSGWQVQNDKPTVQETLQHALSILFRAEPTVTGAGRTDAGVHARGQVAHFDSPQLIDCERTMRSLNGLLPPSISIHGMERVADSFHARYDARYREYHYQICVVPRALERHVRVLVLPPPDLTLMNEAADNLIGSHDFSAFCRIQSETQNRTCTIQTAGWVPEERANDWRFIIGADRFLHGMVRAIVGTLLQVGQKKRSPSEMSDILASGDRRRAGPAAPSKGLVLHQIRYDQ